MKGLPGLLLTIDDWQPRLPCLRVSVARELLLFFVYLCVDKVWNYVAGGITRGFSPPPSSSTAKLPSPFPPKPPPCLPPQRTPWRSFPGSPRSSWLPGTCPRRVPARRFRRDPAAETSAPRSFARAPLPRLVDR